MSNFLAPEGERSSVSKAEWEMTAFAWSRWECEGWSGRTQGAVPALGLAGRGQLRASQGLPEPCGNSSELHLAWPKSQRNVLSEVWDRPTSTAFKLDVAREKR